MKLSSMSSYSISPRSSSLLYAFSFRLSLVTFFGFILRITLPVSVSVYLICRYLKLSESFTM